MNRNTYRNQGKKGQSITSNGPHERVRGTAHQIYDKYKSLAEDASSSGDRVLAENYNQHAEHYNRILADMRFKGKNGGGK